MGAVLIAKPGLNRNISVITFGIAQVAMDIEPGVGMFTGADVLHGPSHTILGALVIAYLVTLIAPSICNYLLKMWNKEVTHHKQPWLVQPEISKTAVTVGAFFGTLSHLALDSLMHHDIQPLAPFSQANPLMGLVTHDEVYQLCSIAGVVGVGAWFAMTWLRRSPPVVAVEVSPEPLVENAPQGFWALWVRELRFTWFWIILMSVVPGLLFGSGFFSVIALAAAALIGVLSAVISRFRVGTRESKGLRRLVVMLLMPMLVLNYVFENDKQIPGNAKPVTQAIEYFRLQTGQYPDSLEVLTPKYLTSIPDLNFSLSQSKITYHVTDGKPYLAVPSARGDAFACYEYNFDTKVWIHRS